MLLNSNGCFTNLIIYFSFFFIPFIKWMQKKNQCRAWTRAHVYWFCLFIFFFFFSSMKIMVVRKHHFHVDFLILLPGENWLINPLSIHLTYHSMGWSISKVSIFIYLSVAVCRQLYTAILHNTRDSSKRYHKKKFYTVGDFKLYWVEKKNA